MANVSPVLRHDFFRTWQPCPRICHSCLFEIITNVTSKFFVPKKRIEPNFQVIVTLSSEFAAILRFFRKNFNGQYLRLRYSQFPFHENSVSSYSFQDTGIRFAAFYSQLICAKTNGNKISNYCLKKNLELPKVKKFGIFFLTFEDSKYFSGENIKFLFSIVFAQFSCE